MSKKNRIKKKNKQKIQKRVEQFSAVENVEPLEETHSEVISNKNESKKALPESTIDGPTQKLISKDVRMIIYTLAGLVILLIAVKVLDIRTEYISSLGDWLYKITNIQTM